MRLKNVLLVVVVTLCSGCGNDDPEPGSECQHTFSAWSDPERTQDWNYGPRFWQSRTCDKCGYGQTRKIKPD